MGISIDCYIWKGRDNATFQGQFGKLDMITLSSTIAFDAILRGKRHTSSRTTQPAIKIEFVCKNNYWKYLFNRNFKISYVLCKVVES